MSTQEAQHQLGKILWALANELRGAMSADDFRDYMLSLLFYRHLSDNYEAEAKAFLKEEYPVVRPDSIRGPLATLYANTSKEDIKLFEEQMRRRIHYVFAPEFLWSNIAALALRQSVDLLTTLENGLYFVENQSFSSNYQGLFSELNLSSDKLGKTYAARNAKLCTIIHKIAVGIDKFPNDSDTLGDAYEYLIGQFAAGSGKKAGEFYTPQPMSTILSRIVSLDGQDPTTGQRSKLNRVLDMTCGSGSLLLNVRKVMGKGGIGRIYGQESNPTTYNLARMNMLLHGVKDNEFSIHQGDTLINDWDILRELNPARKVEFDAIVANPPFSYSWDTTDQMADDFRFKNYGLAPKSAAEFAFLLHGFHFLAKEGTMAIILPHGVLFRGGAEERIRTKLLKDGNIDTVIGLPSNLFYSTSIPVCILVIKKCKQPDDVLFINASEHYAKGKRQNVLRQGTDGEPNDIDKIVETYQYRREEERYSRRVSMAEIEQNGYNLNISRYISTATTEESIDLSAVQQELWDLNQKIADAAAKHNALLAELGLPPIA